MSVGRGGLFWGCEDRILQQGWCYKEYCPKLLAGRNQSLAMLQRACMDFGDLANVGPQLPTPLSFLLNEL